MNKLKWSAEPNPNYTRGKAKDLLSGMIIRYTPPDAKDTDGNTVIGLNFPALAVTLWVADPERIAAQIAHQLNTYGVLFDALKAAQDALHNPFEPDNQSAAHKAVTAAIAAAEAVTS